MAEEARLALSASLRFAMPGSVPTRSRRPVLRGIATGLVALVLALGALPSLAGPSKKNPAWSELSAEQQQILAPLAPPHWDQLEPERKRKWLGIAKRYPKMTPTGQRRVQTRMQKWAALTPEQRREAREKYRRIEKLPPEKRQDLSERWVEYQSLPPHQRQSLGPAEPRSTGRKRSTVKPPQVNPSLATP